MPRTADKPGSYRVRQKGGEWLLSGVRKTGDRFRYRASSPEEAERIATGVFGSSVGIGPISGSDHLPQAKSPETTAVDDWGFPVRVSPELSQSIRVGFNLPAAGSDHLPTVALTDERVKEEAAKKADRSKHAKSLMSVVGMGYAMGTVAVSRRVITNAGKEPCKPDPKQVNDLADCTRDTFIEWFGDREVKPWQMMFLLTLGIPMAMWLQSPKAKPDDKRNLKSVP